MSTLIRFAFLFLLFCAPARAEEVEVGTGPVCGTQKQVERLANLFGDDTDSAINTVNAEERDPTACKIADVAYLRGSRIATVRGKDVTFEIVKILILGVVTPQGVQQTAPAVYFSLFPIDERAA
jgi:hypothetical protein